MNKVIYIGNMLKKHGYNPTSIDTLGVRLMDNFELKRFSDQKLYLFRVVSMIYGLVSNRKKNTRVLIDTYSTSAFHYAWIVALFCLLLKLPYTCVLRGGQLPMRMKKSPFLSRFLFSNAQNNIAPSGFLQNELKSMLNINSIIIPNYIDIDNYPFTPRKSVSEIKLLWVRSFDKIYNPLMAVEVVKILNDSSLKVKLCMVGPDKDGSMKLADEHATKLSVKNLIEFKGRLKKAEWIELSKDYNIFINTTNIDNTPISVMESMALGMPVVTTNVGGVPFLFDNDLQGILIEPRNPEAMAKSIMKLYKNKDLMASISQNARHKAESWDWEMVKKKWISLLSE